MKRLLAPLFLSSLLALWGCDAPQRSPEADPNANPLGAFNPAPGEASGGAETGTGGAFSNPMVTEGDQDDANALGGVMAAELPVAGRIDLETVSEEGTVVFEIVPYDVQTRVGERQTVAGLENRVTCQVLDQQGQPIEALAAEAEVHPDHGFERTDIGVRGHTAREYSITCASTQLGLRDADPAIWTVLPGRAHRVVATLEVSQVSVGDPIRMGCKAYDEFGNIVSTPIDDFDLRLDPPVQRLERRDLREEGLMELEFLDAARFEVGCALPGAEISENVALHVMPGPPATLSATLYPDRPVYTVGSVVELIPLLVDAHGNVIDDLPLDFDLPEGLSPFGTGRYRCDSPGDYHVSVTYDPDPEVEGDELTARRRLTVGYAERGVVCESPLFGSVVNRGPGAHPVSGTAIAPSPITSVRFDDQELEYEDIEALEADGIPGAQAACEGLGIGDDCEYQGTDAAASDGLVPGRCRSGAGAQPICVALGRPYRIRWTGTSPARFGLNVHTLRFTTEGEAGRTAEDRGYCMYHNAEAFDDGSARINDTLLMRLGQGAVDDGKPDQPLGSLTDALRRLLNAAGLRDTVHQSLSAQNPILPNECRVRVFGACLYRQGVDYRNYENRGPNDIDVVLVDGGMKTRAVLRDQVVHAKLRGTFGNSIRLDASRITVDLTFDVGLGGNGQPNVRLRQLNEVSVGDLDADFSGVLGIIFELIFELLEGLVRDTVVDTLRGFLRDNIDRMLTDIFSSLDLGQLSRGFTVPGILDREDVPLVVNVGLSRLDVAPSGITLGVFSQVDGPIRQGDPGLGVPRLPGGEDPLAESDGEVVAGVKLGLLNMVMYRLWRAGYFDIPIGDLVQELGGEEEGVAGDVGGFLDGGQLGLRLSQPPWVTGIDGQSRVRIFVGPLSARVHYPPYTVCSAGADESAEEQSQCLEPIVAAVLTAGVRIEGDRDIVFELPSIEDDQFYFDLRGGVIPIEAATELERALVSVIEGLVDRALNDGLPVVPLPDFALPASLTEFGITPGTRLGLSNPQLQGNAASWTLQGTFGEMP